MTAHGGRRVLDACSDAFRFWPEPVVSCYALLVLLSRFGGPSRSGKAKLEVNRTAWQVCLKSLLARCFQEKTGLILIIALDPTAIVVSGFPVKGHNYLRLPLEGTKLDISPLLCADDRHATPIRELQLEHAVDLSDLL